MEINFLGFELTFPGMREARTERLFPKATKPLSDDNRTSAKA